MSDKQQQEPTLPSFASEALFETEEVTTESGEKYIIGRPKGSNAAQEKAEAAKKEDSNVADDHGPSFDLGVNWPAGSSGGTDSGFASRTGISNYSVPIGGWIFKYRVWFVTDQTYYYEFQDETNQSYPCDVIIPGVHYVDYNSSRPNIVKVRGS